MKAIKKYDDGTVLYFCHAQSSPSGYGHQEITVELEYRGHKKSFKSVTSDMPAFDEANCLEGEEKQLALFKIIHIGNDITEWMLEVDEVESNFEDEEFDIWAKENLED